MNVKDIVFSINNAYVSHLIVTLYSLLIHNSSEELHIHILSSDITPESKDAINSLKELNPKTKISFYSIDVTKFKDLAITMDYITVETYYRLMLAEILPQDIDTVLYLDADILVVGAVGELFSVPLNEYYAAGVPDVYLDQDVVHKDLIGIGDATYVNAGVLLLNLAKIRKDKITSTLIANAKVKTHKYQDQDAINVTFAKKIYVADKRFNYIIKDKQYDSIPNDEQVILHYSGSFKPWNRDRPYDAYSTLYDDYKLRAAGFINERNKHIKYGLLKYSTDNVGDNIQGIAARKFLPSIDYYFERDNMDATKTVPGETVKVIINGWWGDGPENWPSLDQNLDILPISMYVEDRMHAEFEKPRSKAYLNFFGPVGARSHGTERFLNDNGIESYFSGCMTLTINPDKSIKKRDYIVAVDVPDDVYEAMQKQTDRKILRIGVLRKLTYSEEEQYRLAELYLYLYQSAHAVVTTRLHAMLPSLALGTPVLFINDILDYDDVRFSGLAELAYNMRSEDYIAEPKQFDINRPPKNRPDYLKIRKDLERRCKKFTGYMSMDGFLSKPITELLLDSDLLQAVVGGASELGDLKEQNDELSIALSHKENHVRELAVSLEVLQGRYNELSEEFEKLKVEHQRIVHSVAFRTAKKVVHASHRIAPKRRP